MSTVLSDAFGCFCLAQDLQKVVIGNEVETREELTLTREWPSRPEVQTLLLQVVVELLLDVLLKGHTQVLHGSPCTIAGEYFKRWHVVHSSAWPDLPCYFKLAMAPRKPRRTADSLDVIQNWKEVRSDRALQHLGLKACLCCQWLLVDFPDRQPRTLFTSASSHLIMLMKPSLTSSNMMDSSGR